MSENPRFTGKHHSKEAKRKIGDVNRGKIVSKESRQKMSKAKKGKPLSDEHKRDISLAGIGRKHSAETCQKLSDLHRGKFVSKETGRKISAAKKGKPLSKETRLKMSKALMGNTRKRGSYLSDETKQKLSDSLLGRKFSDEHKAKISKALKGKRTGELSHAWKGGISFEPYCPKFNEAFKESVREKFNRVCFLCDMPEVENGQRLSIHHVNYDKTCLCNDIECEFVPLCVSCHTKTNHNRDYWEELILDKLSN